MNYKMITIFKYGKFVNHDWYEFIIEEKWIDGWGKSFACGRRRPKFYSIKKNNKTILSTSLHQTFYSEKRKILNKI